MIQIPVAVGLIVAGIFLTGFESPFLAAGNATSMVVASFLLWSTVKPENNQTTKNGHEPDPAIDNEQ